MTPRQAIKYQSTSVPVEKTLAELAALIKNYGGARFEQHWASDGLVSGVRFAIRHDELGELPVNLTARTARIRSILHEAGLWKSYPPARRERMISEQSERVVWRHLKDLTEQLLLAVSLDLRSLPEAFMADVEIFDRHTGESMRTAEYLERRGRGAPGGLVLEGTGPEDSSALELPAADSD